VNKSHFIHLAFYLLMYACTGNIDEDGSWTNTI